MFLEILFSLQWDRKLTVQRAAHLLFRKDCDFFFFAGFFQLDKIALFGFKNGTYWNLPKAV